MEIELKDKKKMIGLRKKKNGIRNGTFPVEKKFLKVISDFITKYESIIFLYQVENVITLTKDRFYKYCHEWDELYKGEIDTPILDEIHLLLSINKSSVTDNLRSGWLNDDKRTSPSERILLYKLCATRDELDIINDTHEKSLENTFVINSPLKNKNEEDYENTVKMLDELDGN